VHCRQCAGGRRLLLLIGLVGLLLLLLLLLHLQLGRLEGAAAAGGAGNERGRDAKLDHARLLAGRLLLLLL